MRTLDEWAGLPCVSGPQWAGVRSLATTREGGVGEAPYDTFNLGDHVGDDPLAVRRNREHLRAVLPGAPLWLRQVHGVAVHDADAGNQIAAENRSIEADAAVTMQPGRVLAIMTADCLPVVLTDTSARVLGVAHAGWRGLLDGVLERTLAQMQTRLSEAQGGTSDALAWRAWIGPAIGPQAYEVGEDVHAGFLARAPEAASCFLPVGWKPGKWWMDLPALAAQRLRRAGVQEVEWCGFCTATDRRFFSYRRANVTGRIATLAWLDEAFPG